jgi:hypothetical protein
MKSMRLAHWRTVSMEGKIKGEPIFFREPAELGSGEGRPEHPAHDVATSFEHPAHETRELMPGAGFHERRTALGGDHHRRAAAWGLGWKASAGLELPAENLCPEAPVQCLQRGWLGARRLWGSGTTLTSR